MKPSTAPEKAVKAIGAGYTWAANKFYIDEVYLFITKKLIFSLVGRPAAWFDRNVIDGIMNGMAFVTTTSSEAIKYIQSGRLQTYAYFSLGGIIGLIILMIFI
jgi:NADH-quinone oxidoreductase subunit L